MARRATNKSSNTASKPSSVQNQRSSVPVGAQGPHVTLLLTVVALVLLGLVMLYSASSIEAISEGSSPAAYVIKQAVFLVIGTVCALIVWKIIPYQTWQGGLTWVVWGIALILLVLTAVMGVVGLGAKRWLVLGPISLQPSEFAKIDCVLVLARLVYDLRLGKRDFAPTMFMIALMAFAPLLIILGAQSDLGTTMICAMGILAVLWIGDVPLVVIFLFVAAGVVLVAVGMTASYRQDRFVFINPWNDGQGGYGTGYQIIHSFYAFAQGGIFGVGLGNSREKFLYLPEAETDFIYSIIGEELGMIGAVLVIVLYVVFLLAGLRIARNASDSFGATIAGSFAVMIVFQAFMNIAMAIGIFPTTGKPLPFISNGGSSLIASMIMVGFMLSVAEGSSKLDEYERRRNNLRIVRADPAYDDGIGRSSGSRGTGGSRSSGSRGSGSLRGSGGSRSSRGSRDWRD